MSDTATELPEGAEAPPPQIDEAVERRARDMGWVPKEQWHGEPDRWRPADEYVEYAERILPRLQHRNRVLEQNVGDLRKQVDEQTGTLRTLVDSARRAEQVGYNRAMRELRERRAEAVRLGDADAFQKVEAEMQELGPPPQAAPAPAQPTNGTRPDPVVAAWIRRNPWFTRDPEANAQAVAALSVVEREMPGVSLEDHLVEVERRVARRFPEHFGGGTRRAAPEAFDDDFEPPPPRSNPRRSTPAMVAASSASTPTSSARRPGPRSFEAMPADVKAQFERQRKMLEGKGDPLTKEEFASYYWQAEGEEP